jgi:hypothetical protein
MMGGANIIIHIILIMLLGIFIILVFPVLRFFRFFSCILPVFDNVNNRR